MTAEELTIRYPVGTPVHAKKLEWTINGAFRQLSDGKIVVPLKRTVQDQNLVAHRMAGFTELTFGDEDSESWEQAECYAPDLGAWD